MEPGANQSEPEKSEEVEEEGEISHFLSSRFFSPLQLFCPTLPYLNALNRLTFQSMMINRAYFMLLIFWQVI